MAGMFNETKNAAFVGSTSKEDRYKWIKDHGAPGKMMWLDKDVLLTDHAYQREAVDNKKVDGLAATFSWPAFGVLVVAKRGEKYFIIDGQHRYLASKKRASVQKVPCIVFESDGKAFEARTFLDANTRRKPVSYAAKHKALLTAGDSDAKKIHKLVTDHGREISTRASDRTVSCVHALYSLLTSNPDALYRVWPLVMDLCIGRDVPEKVLSAVCYIEKNIQEGESLADDRWRGRLMKIGVDKILAKMNGASLAFSRGGAKVWAMALVENLNSGARGQKLHLKTDDKTKSE